MKRTVDIPAGLSRNHRFSVVKFFLLALLCAATAGAADAPQAPPPADVYFQPAFFALPRVSPDGHRVAALTRFDHRHYALVLVDLDTGKVSALIKQRNVSVTGFAWKNDNLILVSLANDEGGQLMQSIEPQTGTVHTLDRLNLNSAGLITSYLFGDPTYIICPRRDGDLCRVDVRTGKFEVIEKAVWGIDNWIVDSAGEARAGIGHHDGKWLFIWRSEPKEPWQRHEEFGHRPTIYPLAVTSDRTRLVALERPPEGTMRLAYFDLKTGTTTEIYRNPEVDVTTVKLWGHRFDPAAALYTTDRDHLVPFLPDAETSYRLLAQALPNLDCATTSFSDDDQRAVIIGTSDREAGSYYLLDRKTGRLAPLGTALPALPAPTLAASRFFQFQTRDGLTLTARVTLPPNVSRPPLLVRTGPDLVGPRTSYTYDSVAQFLASRGVASVRIDTRGTEGFGSNLLRAGDLEISGGVVDDLEAGVAALVAQGIVDGARVGVLGVGDGGVVAVHAAKRPRFKVLVNIDTPMTVARASLAQLVPSDRDDAELTRLLGGPAAAAAYIKSLEPLDAVAALRIPSFHCYPHGEAGFEMTESGRMLEAALKKSPVPHVFHLEPLIKPETDEAKVTGARFEAIAEFLRKYL